MASTVMGNMIAADNQIDVDVYARGEDGRGIVSTLFEYKVADSGTTIPTGTWSTDIPSVGQGQYLWIRTTSTYNDDTTMVSYNLSYFSIDGKNGAIFTPSIDANGNISWTNDQGLPNPETQNIRGPQGLPGAVSFEFVNTLPVTDIKTDTFYVMPSAHESSIKKYDEYFYINDRWEILGEDLTNFYDKAAIDQLFNDFVATYITVNNAESNKNYYLTGVENAGNTTLRKTGISYQKANGADNGQGFIDEEQITTNLFYSIS